MCCGKRVQLHSIMNRWTSDTYRTNAAYVPTLGAALLALLDPKTGERILDIGCGEGSLTEHIVAAGASVVGVDTSEEMVAGKLDRALRLPQVLATANP